MTNRDLDFLYEIGTLKNMQRGWGQHINQKMGSVLEHIYRVMWLALMIAKMEKAGDEAKIIKMAMAHDLAETRTSDLSYIQKVYVEADEDRAAQDLFAGTMLEKASLEILQEYKKRESLEARIVKDADNLDVDLEMKEIEANGFKSPKEWEVFRKMIRSERLYTESAKKIWDEIQNSNINDWHVKANKWVKLPNAGK